MCPFPGQGAAPGHSCMTWGLSLHVHPVGAVIPGGVHAGICLCTDPSDHSLLSTRGNVTPELVFALSGALWRAEGAHHGLDRGWQQRPALPDGERRQAGDAPADCHAQGERNQRGEGKANLTQTSSNTQALIKGPSWGVCNYPECLLSELRCKILIQLFGCKAGAILLSPTSEMGIHDRECSSWRITVPFDKALQSHPVHSPHQKKKKKKACFKWVEMLHLILFKLLVQHFRMLYCSTM